MTPATWPPIPMPAPAFALPAAPLLAQDSQDALLSFMLLTGLALIVASLVMMLRKRRQRTRTEPTAREQLERSREKQRMRGDLEQLMVELEQLTKRFSAQLDAKTLQLEKLIDHADRRIDELKRLQGEAPASGQTPSTPEASTPEAAERALRAASIGIPANDRGRASAGVADSPSRAAAHAASTGGLAPLHGSDRTTAFGEDTLTRNVYALADEGLDAAHIARELDEHIGKIELMLALRKA